MDPNFDLSHIPCLNSTVVSHRDVDETCLQDATSCSFDDFRSAARAENLGAPLNGCRILLFGGKNASKARKIVVAAGGEVSDELTDDVTHIVVDVTGENPSLMSKKVATLIRSCQSAEYVKFCCFFFSFF